MSQSVRNIFRDLLENIVNVWLKCIHYTSCLTLSSEEKYAASLGTKAKQIFF